jgi:hypothetical protein
MGDRIVATQYRVEITGSVGDLQAYLDNVAKDGGLVIAVVWLPKDALDGPGYLVVSEHTDKDA